VRDKGLKIDAAKEQLRTNKTNVTKRLKAIERLEKVRGELQSMLDALTVRAQKNSINDILEDNQLT
jgi:hypothetical protein